MKNNGLLVAATGLKALSFKIKPLSVILILHYPMEKERRI